MSDEAVPQTRVDSGATIKQQLLLLRRLSNMDLSASEYVQTPIHNFAILDTYEGEKVSPLVKVVKDPKEVKAVFNIMYDLPKLNKNGDIMVVKEPNTFVVADKITQARLENASGFRPINFTSVLDLIHNDPDLYEKFTKGEVSLEGVAGHMNLNIGNISRYRPDLYRQEDWKPDGYARHFLIHQNGQDYGFTSNGRNIMLTALGENGFLPGNYNHVAGEENAHKFVEVMKPYISIHHLSEA